RPRGVSRLLQLPLGGAAGTQPAGQLQMLLARHNVTPTTPSTHHNAHSYGWHLAVTPAERHGPEFHGAFLAWWCTAMVAASFLLPLARPRLLHSPHQHGRRDLLLAGHSHGRNTPL